MTQTLVSRSLATTCCVCRRFEHVASSPELWEPLAQLRWSHLHPNLYPAQPSAAGFSAERRRKDKPVVERIPVDGVQNVSVPEGPTPSIQHLEDTETVTACDIDWRALYAGSNGWRRLPQEEEAGRGAGAYSGPRLGQRCLPMAAECEFVSALASCGLMELQLNHGASESDAVLIATSHSIEAWNPGDSSSDLGPYIETIVIHIRIINSMHSSTFCAAHTCLTCNALVSCHACSVSTSACKNVSHIHRCDFETLLFLSQVGRWMVSSC